MLEVMDLGTLNLESLVKLLEQRKIKVVDLSLEAREGFFLDGFMRLESFDKKCTWTMCFHTDHQTMICQLPNQTTVRRMKLSDGDFVKPGQELLSQLVSQLFVSLESPASPTGEEAALSTLTKTIEQE